MNTQVSSVMTDNAGKPFYSMHPKTRCPRCGSDAIYKYGRTKNQKTRYLCLVCNRQFVPGARRVEPIVRPNCPACGKTMHVYMRGTKYNRFRCADYPECRTFLKVMREKG